MHPVCLTADSRNPASLLAVQKRLAILSPEGFCVVIGNFDGVHRGHQSLFAVATASSYPVLALTFDPHPREVFGLPHARLLSTEDRVRLLHEAGAELVVLLTFSTELATMTPADFADQILAQTLHTRTLILGYDFVLGRAREGTAAILIALGQTHGFDLHQIPALLDCFQNDALKQEMFQKQKVLDGQSASNVQGTEGEIISSTRIRDCLERGEVDKAASQLGRPYHLTGTVVQGFQRGRLLGFPTANLALAAPAPMQPGPGVYATTIRCEGAKTPLLAVTNIGRNPTFGNETLSIETHILDFSDNLYGKQLTVRFHHRLRSERKFDSLEALKAQLSEDVAQARTLLERTEHGF